MMNFKDGGKVSPFILFALTLTACGGKSGPASDGMLSMVNNKLTVIRDTQKQQAVCKTQYCEPNYILHEAVEAKKVRNPSLAPTATGVDKTTDRIDYSLTKMNVQDAWQITEGSSDVIVAIIDSGVDLNHPDLKDNIVQGYDFYAKKADPTDEAGHGTHVAGIIAASKNGFGMVGVAPHVKIMPLRFIGPDGSGDTADAIDAIHYAIKMGAKVISASWGGEEYSSFLAQAVKDAQDAGIIFVAAAGNQSYDTTATPYYPGSLPNVVSVASSDENDQLSSYSNFGNTVMIAAPGDDIYSTYLNDGYETLSGTSMAAPQVSGAIALALSKNQSVQPAQLLKTLCQTADAVLRGPTQCGRINVGLLLKNL